MTLHDCVSLLFYFGGWRWMIWWQFFAFSSIIPPRDTDAAHDDDDVYSMCITRYLNENVL